MFDNLRRHVKNVRNEHDVSEAKRDAVCNEQRFEHNDNIVNNVECKGLTRELFERCLAREEKDMLWRRSKPCYNTNDTTYSCYCYGLLIAYGIFLKPKSKR